MAKQALDLRMATRLLSPGPVTLLTTQYRGQPNVMAVAWAAPVSLDPPLIGVAIYPGRLTHEFLLKSEQFVLNVPSLEIITATHQCGIISGRAGDKFAATGLTPELATEVDPPLIAECLAHLECGVVERVRLGDHDLFVGQPLALAADEAAFDGFWQTDGEEGSQILHHLGADRYAALAKTYRAS
jgi:flavin reductase (DIM6/NTAB) family NADH-FMN oxidoreductase RutF